MRKVDERNYQTTWEDLQAWVDQLYEDHQVRLDIQVCLHPLGDTLAPAVVVTARRRNRKGLWEEVKRDYRPFRTRAVGMVERESLQMVSQLLLELDNDKAAAEQQRTLFSSL